MNNRKLKGINWCDDRERLLVDEIKIENMEEQADLKRMEGGEYLLNE